MAKKTLRIHETVSDNNTERLNYFAGRYLSEQEFDLMQQYVDERCEDLLCASHPGILQGLEVHLEANGEDIDIVVKPGLAVTGSGRAVNVGLPIHLDWPSLLLEYNTRVTPADQEPVAVHGYYFLTVKRQVAILDESEGAEPCTRFEQDPLRDSRLETWATLDLQPVSAISSWMAASQTRVVSRVFNRYLTETPFNSETNAVPLALLKIDTDALVWIDTQVGRFMSEAYPVHNNMLAWWQQLARNFELADDYDPANPLSDILDCDYLPATGPLPDVLVSNIPGGERVDNPDLWTRPQLAFTPYDLQIEMVPIPHNAAQGIMATELNRGVVDISHFQQDRIRIMVAVEADDYRADLLNLPSVDIDLLNEFQDRYGEAASAYNLWAEKYFEIYGNLELGAGSDLLPDDELEQLYATIYVAQGPDQSFSRLTADQRELLNLPVVQPAPQALETYLNTLREQRRENDQLPRPYSQTTPETNQPEIDPVFPDPLVDGLYRQRELLRQKIETIEEFIDQSTDLLNATTDFITLQRQQLDHITVSFSALAGGVPGDGSGLSLMRWADSLKYADTSTDQG